MNTDQMKPQTIQPGAIVRTSYGTGPYIVLSVEHDCTCACYLDQINMSDPPPSPPHMHLACAVVGDPDRTEQCWLGGYVDSGNGRLRSIWSDDEVFIDGMAPGQMELFSSVSTIVAEVPPVPSLAESVPLEAGR